MSLARQLALRVLALCASVGAVCEAQATTPPASQNPSPMVENTRAHQRLAPRPLNGIAHSFTGPLNRPVAVFIPAGVRASRPVDLVIHFMGASFIAEQAVVKLGRNHVVASVMIGAGSGLYDRTFRNPAVYDTLLRGISREVAAALKADSVAFRRVTLTGFSAGHGAIRAILRDSANFARVHGVLLMDGLHTSYVPEGVVMEKGGTLDESNLESIARFARAAMRGEKRMLITHSEIFPGTFASTTETADWLVRTLGLERKAVLEWGPRGLQQVGAAKSGRLEIRGYAGNSAPDHIDHFHAMPELLADLLR